MDFKTEAKITHSIELHPLKTLEGHVNGVDCVKFNPVHKTQLVSGSFDHTFRSWDISKGVSVKELLAHEGGIWSIDFSKDGKYFTTASADKSLKIWDAASFKETGSLKGHTSHVYSVAYSPDSFFLASSGEDGTVRIWDLKKNQVHKTIEIGSRIGLSTVYSQDGKYLFVAALNGQVIAYETATFSEVARTGKFENTRAYSVSVDFTHINLQNYVFAAYEDHYVRKWKLDGFSLTLDTEFIAHADHTKHIVVNGDYGVFATCGRDGSAKVWNASNNDLIYNLVGATDSTTMSAFANDDHRILAVSSWDQRIRLYQIPEKIPTSTKPQ